MQPPFTLEEFLGVFARYNLAVWPLQVGLYAVAALLVALAARPSRRSGRWIAGLLAALWAWMGIVYHWAYFARINPAAYLFGGLFVLQALAFVAAGVRGQLRFRVRRDASAVAGAALIAYALVLYPLLGARAGHAFPNGPTFGLPCPTTIFTLGLLLWTVGRVPPWLLAVPVAWSLLGSTAALRFGIAEDHALPVAGVVAAFLILRRNHRLRRGATGEARLAGSGAASPAGIEPGG